MIDFNDLDILRIIVHQIKEKNNTSPTAISVPGNEIIDLSDDVLAKLRERLIEASGARAKTFELTIARTDQESFFGLSNDLKSLDDASFIARSVEILRLLAGAQRRKGIPGGYVLIIDGVLSSLNTSVYIVIKAEPHEAMKLSRVNGRSQLEVLKDVFLSPSQRLFKIGYLLETTIGNLPRSSDDFKAYIFDEQFTPSSKSGEPATYFYRDFLGFSVDENAKLLCNRFYDQTSKFIESRIHHYQDQRDLMGALRNVFTIDTAAIVNPMDFGNSFFQSDVRDEYIQEIVDVMPDSFVKDGSLVNNKLRKGDIKFSSGLSIKGTAEIIEENVKIILNDTDFNALIYNDQMYTVVKIQGKPYRNG